MLSTRLFRSAGWCTYVSAAMVVLGAVLIVYCLLARRAGDWSNRQVWFGILAGVGYVLTIAGFLVGGMNSPVTYVGGLLTVIFYTVWAIGFGRLLSRMAQGVQVQSAMA